MFGSFIANVAKGVILEMVVPIVRPIIQWMRERLAHKKIKKEVKTKIEDFKHAKNKEERSKHFDNLP